MTRQRAEADLDSCWLCSQPIDYTAEARTPESWSMDHIVPMVIDITLAHDPGNVASAHYGCNSARGGDPAWMASEAVTRETTSIDW